MQFNPELFQSFELAEIAAKVNANPKNYKKEFYGETISGKTDHALLSAATIAKNFWAKNKDEPLPVSFIRNEYKYGHPQWLPSAIIKLRNMGMFKLAAQQTVVMPGKNWIENGSAQENE